MLHLNDDLKPSSTSEFATAGSQGSLLPVSGHTWRYLARRTPLLLLPPSRHKWDLYWSLYSWAGPKKQIQVQSMWVRPSFNPTTSTRRVWMKKCELVRALQNTCTEMPFLMLASIYCSYTVKPVETCPAAHLVNVTDSSTVTSHWGSQAIHTGNWSVDS